MNNQIIIIIMIRILSVTLLLPTITIEFLTLATPNAFAQQVMFGSIDKGSAGYPSDTTSNNNMGDYNIASISTITGILDSNGVPSSNMNETIAGITVVDVINSTYTASEEIDQNETERRITRAIRDRINDVLHTVVMSNATIISTATIENEFLDESYTVRNYTRLLEIIREQVGVAFTRLMAVPQPTNSLLELNTDIQTVYIANSTSIANCDIHMKIR